MIRWSRPSLPKSGRIDTDIQSELIMTDKATSAQDGIMKIIGMHVIDPANTLFGSKGDKARSIKFYCSDAGCPLLANRQCLNVLPLTSCKAGKTSRKEGYTRRARNWGTWMLKEREEAAQHGELSAPRRDDAAMTKLGGYVYLPYPHANIVENDSGDFIFEREGAFKIAEKFIPVELFNAEFVIRLIRHKPYALMGGEITSYQKEEVPKIIKDCAEKWPHIWRDVIESNPDIGDIREKQIARLAAPIKQSQLRRKESYRCVWNEINGTLFTGSYGTKFTYHSDIHGNPAKIEVSITDDDEIRLIDISDLSKQRMAA